VLTVSVAQALNAFGSGIAPIAVAFALLGDRDGVAKFSAVLAVGALAPVVMTLAGGVLADRGRSPIRTTQVLRCLAGVVQVLLWVGLLHARSSIVVIGGLLFLGEALSSLTLPSSRRMIAEVVEGEELTRAVATQATLVNLARIASPSAMGCGGVRNPALGGKASIVRVRERSRWTAGSSRCEPEKIRVSRPRSLTRPTGSSRSTSSRPSAASASGAKSIPPPM